VTRSMRYQNATAVTTQPPWHLVANAQTGHCSTIEEGKIKKYSCSSFARKHH